MHPPSRPIRPDRASAAVLGLLLWLLAAASARGEIPILWPEAAYNPAPRLDDLLLPMPCGGAMAFRIVAVGPEGRRLPDAVLGPDGPFPLGPNGQGACLLGKYEVNRLQAAALRAYATGADGDSATPPPGLYVPRVVCPRPSGPPERLADQAQRNAARAERLPQASIAWADAAALAADYAAWLGRNAPDIPACPQPPGRACLPRLEGRPATVRLPSAAEWEYAARGGQAVDPSGFEAPGAPFGAALARHAWIKDNANGDPEPIGTRAAGPLGLHDLYGNVSEWLAEPLAGESGPQAAVAGGSFYSTGPELAPGSRAAVALYDGQGRVHTSDTGLRLAIGAPAPERSQASEGIGGSLPRAVPRLPPESDAPREAELPLWRASWLGLGLAGLALAQGLGLLWLLPRRRRSASSETAAPAVAAPGSPRARERALALTPERRGEIAARLYAQGYLIAGADARPRRRFAAAQRKAIGALEQDLGLAPTGYLSEPVLAELARRSAELSGAGRPNP